jgi:hypothetical protein
MWHFPAAEHPELGEAIAYALREVTATRPSSPIRVVAEKLLEFNDQLHSTSTRPRLVSPRGL